ncbi:DUF2493 domain-containing protein [Cupriavidus plantarum]|uniref:Uncharacterized protein DUF2493 n=1 Tax=Cupriavidus plantarum TaxID=942865 RepID=A0A316F4K4_9BURK|nr:uncharacterized protein DUF2493 [Cupriavidus plantarum]
MRLLVCGARDYNDQAPIRAVLDRVHQCRPVSVLIDGEARGADTIAEGWAISRGVPVLPFPADADYAAAGCRRGH